MQKTAILVFAALTGTTLPVSAQLGPSDPGAAVLSPRSLTGEPSTAPQRTSKLQELVTGNLSGFGNIEYTGEVKDQRVHVSGFGRVRRKD